MKKGILYDQLFNHPGLHPRLRDRAYQAALRDFLDGATTIVQYPRPQNLLMPGQVAKHIYFVLQGLARIYYESDQLRQVTLFLLGEKSFVTDPDSFYHQLRSRFFIEVIAGTEIISIDHQQYMACTEKFPETEFFTRYLLLQYNRQHAKRMEEMACIGSWQRYLNLLKTHPSIEQKVSKEVIASYLNITPQSLSRLLKDNKHP